MSYLEIPTGYLVGASSGTSLQLIVVDRGLSSTKLLLDTTFPSPIAWYGIIPALAMKDCRDYYASLAIVALENGVYALASPESPELPPEYDSSIDLMVQKYRASISALKEEIATYTKRLAAAGVGDPLSTLQLSPSALSLRAVPNYQAVTIGVQVRCDLPPRSNISFTDVIVPREFVVSDAPHCMYSELGVIRVPKRSICGVEKAQPAFWLRPSIYYRPDQEYVLCASAILEPELGDPPETAGPGSQADSARPGEALAAIRPLVRTSMAIAPFAFFRKIPQLPNVPPSLTVSIPFEDVEAKTVAQVQACYSTPADFVSVIPVTKELESQSDTLLPGLGSQKEGEVVAIKVCSASPWSGLAMISYLCGTKKTVSPYPIVLDGAGVSARVNAFCRFYERGAWEAELHKLSMDILTISALCAGRPAVHGKVECPAGISLEGSSPQEVDRACLIVSECNKLLRSGLADSARLAAVKLGSALKQYF